MAMFKPSILTLALTAAGLSSFATTAAQEETIKNDDVEIIEVKGFRRSLIQAIDTKRFSSSVVEAISAEDIGKLPDSSIAESIARLPGLAAQRLDGRASSITIRGMGEDFSTTTFNGREQVSIGDNRGVEYDLYPSEVISEVVVYKTPDASLTTQGIGGTVDLRSTRPLSAGEQSITANVRFEQNEMDAVNPEMDNKGYRGSFGYVDQFADDTIGVAFAYAHMESPNQEQRWNAWGYDPSGADGDLRLTGAKPYARSSELTRDSFLGVLEFAPSDKLHITADAMYVDFEDKQILRGIELPLNSGRADTNYETLATNGGVVTQGQVNNIKTLVRNDVNFRTADLLALGFNVEYDINDSWQVAADVSYSKVERDVWGLESYAATGRGDNEGLGDNLQYSLDSGMAGAIFTPTLDYSDRDLFQLGAARTWGNSVVGGDGQDGFLNRPHVEDELASLKLSAKTYIENSPISQVEFGVNYSSREKDKQDTGEYLRLKQYPEMVRIPDEYYLGSVSLDFIGMGDMIAYDSLALYNSGAYDSFNQADTDTGRWANIWTVQEDILTAYVKADLDTELFGLPARGNVGLQIVNTDQSSDGYAVDSDPDTGLVRVQSNRAGDKYTEFLPSLNLNLSLTEDQMLRFGLARTMSRSRMDRMNASNSYSFDAAKNNVTTPPTNLENSPWSASGGNPSLRPVIANQIDLSYEYYFSAEGYFAAALFHKDIEDWQFNTQIVGDFADVDTPNGEVPITNQGLVSAWDNVGDAKVSGLELTATLPGNILSDSLEGFGTVISATFLDSSLDNLNGEKEEIPGLSDKVYNWTLYYENYGFQARVSMRYRSDFLGEVNGLSLARTTVVVAEETIWDAQIGYDFSESSIEALQGLTVSLQAQNLTDEPFVTYHDGNKATVRDYQSYGANYLLGFAYKF